MTAALALIGGVQAQMDPLENCMTIVPNAFNFHWRLNNVSNTITIMTETSLESNMYVAWAVPGDNAANGNGNAMLPNGDAQASLVANGQPTVADAYMTALRPCDGQGNGVCPDSVGNNGTQSNMNITGAMMNGITYVMYDRNLIANETEDMDISTADNTLFLFAAGPVVGGVPQVHGMRAGVPLSLANGPGVMCMPLMGTTTNAPTITTPPVNTVAPTDPPRDNGPVSGAASLASAGALVLACAGSALLL